MYFFRCIIFVCWLRCAFSDTEQLNGVGSLKNPEELEQALTYTKFIESFLLKLKNKPTHSNLQNQICDCVKKDVCLKSQSGVCNHECCKSGDNVCCLEKKIITPTSSSSVPENVDEECDCIQKNLCSVDKFDEFCPIGTVCCPKSKVIVNQPLFPETRENRSAGFEFFYETCGIVFEGQVGVPPTEDDQFFLNDTPWMVRIKGNGVPSFGGTLIHPKAIITLNSLAITLNSQTLIYAGNSPNISPQRALVKSVIHHPQYNKAMSYNIAILILISPVELGYDVTPACVIPPKTEFKFQDCVASQYKSDLPKFILKNFAIRIDSKEDCNKVDLLCVQEESCDRHYMGGGPVICPSETHRKIVTGLVNWNQNCPKKQPFVDVSYHYEWIKKTLKEQNVII